jgi:hypothetical protein
MHRSTMRSNLPVHGSIRSCKARVDIATAELAEPLARVAGRADAARCPPVPVSERVPRLHARWPRDLRDWRVRVRGAGEVSAGIGRSLRATRCRIWRGTRGAWTGVSSAEACRVRRRTPMRNFAAGRARTVTP